MIAFPLLSLWDKKALVFNFSLIGVKLRYKGTYLGFLWNVLEPILTFLILYVVFTSIRERSGDFGIYLLTGIVMYHVFARGTLNGLASFHNNKNFIITLNINREFYPAIAVGSVTLTTLVEVAVLFALFPFFQFTPDITALLIFLPVLLILLLVLGLTYLLSVISVFLKDIQPLWAVIVHVIFFISPIFWYVKDVDGILLDILKINPVGQIIELTHHIVVFGQIPPLNDWLNTLAIVLGILFFGFFVFKKYQNKIAEEL